MKKYNFMSIGYDCSPAAALRTLNLREHALPFDWIVSKPSFLHQCFEDNFTGFHTELKYNENKQTLVDKYGFQFPHDYPLIDDLSFNPLSLGEGEFGQQTNKIITPDWNNYYHVVKAKYERRIQRFLEIVQSPLPIIMLCTYKTSDVLTIHFLFNKFYNKQNIIFYQFYE